MKPNRNKYNAKKYETGGKVYDSKLEGYVASQLNLMKKAGEIDKIQEQVRVKFIINGVLITSNYVDFRCEMSNGEVWYVEAKGKETDRYRLLKKLHEAMLDEIEPGAKYFLVKGRVGKINWHELKLKRR